MPRNDFNCASITYTHKQGWGLVGYPTEWLVQVTEQPYNQMTGESNE